MAKKLNETPVALTVKAGLSKEIYDQAKLEGQTIEQILEILDPSDQWKGTEFENFTAFQRQLFAFGIKTSGNFAVNTEAFFQTEASKALYPEFWDRNLMIGMLEDDLDIRLEDLVSATNEIEGSTYKGLRVDFTKSNFAMAYVGEGTDFPTAIMKTAVHSVDTAKIGIKVLTTYEVIRRVKVNILAHTIQLIGKVLRQDLVGLGLSVLMNGDGNGNSAAPVDPETLGSISWNDLVEAFFSFKGFRPTLWACNSGTLKDIVKLPEFKEPLVAKEFNTTGKIISPFGVPMKVNDLMPSKTIVPFNRKAGLEMVKEKGARLTEVDKLISTQEQETVISDEVAFRKIWDTSAYVLDYN